MPPGAIEQEEIVKWLQAFVPVLSLAWYRDIGEASYLLNDQGWQALREGAYRPDTSEQTRQLLSALCHEIAAEVMIEIACAQRYVSADTARAIHMMGMVAAGPLVRFFNKGGREEEGGEADVEQLAALVELMGYAGYAQSTRGILTKIAYETTWPDRLVAEAYKALARWGDAGSDVLQNRLRNAGELSPGTQKALVEALVVLPVDDDFLDAIRGYLGQKGVQQALAVQTVQGKLQRDGLPHSDRESFMRLLQRDLSNYGVASRSRWRRILKWLEKGYLRNPDSRRSRSCRGLFDAMRALSSPTASFLRSVLQICAEVEDDVARRWIEYALQDPCLEARPEAMDSFVSRSSRLEDPYRWLDEIRHDLPEHVTLEIERRLAPIVEARRAQQTISA